MTLNLDNSDLETFSGFLGLNGTDADLFYEIYYSLDTESLEIEESWMEIEGT